MKKLLPKRKPERKPSDEEFALRKSKLMDLFMLLMRLSVVADILLLCNCNRYCSTGRGCSDPESD